MRLVSWREIALSFGLALLLSIVSMPEILRPLRPDWVALTLIFWCLVRPDTIGIWTALGVGVFLDALSATLLGQHALGLIFIAYLTLGWQPWLRHLPPWRQVWVVFALLLVYRLVLLWVISVVSQLPHKPDYWWPVVSGAVLWPWFYVLQCFLWPQARGGK